MTGHQINSLVGDLVAMAQAMEKLPLVEAALDEARIELDHKVSTIQRLELKLMDRAGEIDKLNASIRELEVAKDVAETMFLEADDRTARALDFVKTMFGSAGSLIQALEPVKAQPEPEAKPVWHGDLPKDEPVPEGQHVEGQSDRPFVGHSDNEGMSQSKPIDNTSAEGQSAADPTALAMPIDNGNNVQSSGANTTETVSQPETTSYLGDSDPEPTPKWSADWWDWKYRNDAKQASTFG
jgi:hypothetical protein